MKKKKVFVSIISLVLLIAMSLFLVERDEKQDNIVGVRQDERSFTVTQVIDGDTIMVDMDGDEKRVRLIGMDTPELVHPNKPVECFAREASSKMRELTLGKNVILRLDKTQDNLDRYGRLLRYVHTTYGVDVNFTMIEQGYAFEYTYRVPYEKQGIYKNAEKYARENKLGLWNPEYCEYD